MEPPGLQLFLNKQKSPLPSTQHRNRRRDRQEHLLQQRCLPWLPSDSGYLEPEPLFPSHCRCSSSWPSLFKQQKPCFCGKLHLVWEFAFFSSPPSSKHFVCLFFLNHRHIYINNTRDSLLGFPHLLPALNTKYTGPHIHACHLRGCLNSSYQQELDFIPSLYQSVLCRQKNPFKTL